MTITCQLNALCHQLYKVSLGKYISENVASRRQFVTRKGARLARELAQSPLTRVNRLHYATKHALIG